MYETETNRKIDSVSVVPAVVRAALGQLRVNVVQRTVLPWSEHCTECVWPTCYSSCDLYAPREDGRCRRFVDGMVRVDCSEAISSYLLKIRFKRWAKLWSPGNVRLYPVQEALELERRDLRIATLLQGIPLPKAIRRSAATKRYSWKKRSVHRLMVGPQLPTAFILECYNPGSETVALSLTMRAVDETIKIPFQILVTIAPGFHRERIAIEEIANAIDIESPFNIEIIPSGVESDDQVTLYFGLLDFVRETSAVLVKGSVKRKVKCVVWDLDNTLWDGVLVEDGEEKLKLKPGIVDIIKQLDARGVLNSVASKNNADEALQVLKRFGLEEYFLCPQISWQPKSEGVEVIAKQLNIGKEALLFVDDSTFELEQVRERCPEVMLMDAKDYPTILQMKECQSPVTQESASRRKMYQVEAVRQNLAGTFGSDYLSFLRHCNIELNIHPMTLENLERVHELTQRTNQMNFSGNRYDREVLQRILESSQVDTFVLDCSDRFGSYGIIGFCLVDSREPRMTDLMFSCRIQSKRVEHAFLCYIIRRYIAETGRDFYANYRKTPRNSPSGRVFGDIGMQEIGESQGVLNLVFRKDEAIPDDGIIRVHAELETVA